MKSHQLTATGGVFSVPCPAGMEVRIVAVRCTVSGAQIGDQTELHYIRESVLLIVASKANTINTVEFNAAIGIEGIAPLANLIDPVTGAVSYADVITQCMALPNVWWPHEIIVSPIAPNATLTPVVLIYELRSMN